MSDLKKIHACRALEDLLVDYADGAASGVDAARAQRHLAGCAACRQELAALRRSLEVARAVWVEAASGEAAGSSPPRWRPRYGRIAAALGGVAATLALAVGIYRGGPEADDSAAVAAGGPDVASEEVDPAAATGAVEMDDGDLDVEAYIRRQEQAARLAASVGVLSDLPVDRKDLEKAERYLRITYGMEATGLPAGESGEL